MTWTLYPYDLKNLPYHNIYHNEQFKPNSLSIISSPLKGIIIQCHKNVFLINFKIPSIYIKTEKLYFTVQNITSRERFTTQASQLARRNTLF